MNGRAKESESVEAEEKLGQRQCGPRLEESSSTGSRGADAVADGKGDHRSGEGKRKSPRVHSLTPAPYRKRNWSADWARLRHRQAKSPSESRCGLVAPYPFRGRGESQPALPGPSPAQQQKQQQPHIEKQPPRSSPKVKRRRGRKPGDQQ